MMALADTPNFGFTRLGVGESAERKNGGAFRDADRSTLDTLLHALLNHGHDGGPALTAPAEVKQLVGQTTGGRLPGGTTFYYVISYLDRWGLETARSPEKSIATEDAASPPTAPILTHQPSGGTLAPGRYSYLLTFADASGGETQAGAAANIDLVAPDAAGSSQVTLTLPTAPSVASRVNIYRARPGQTQYYYLTQVTSGTSYTDSGAISEDVTRTVPYSNTTSARNQVIVYAPNPHPEGVTAWRIYRTTTPGSYGPNSLVHTVVETTSGTLSTNYVDTGEPLLPGVPRSQSATVSGGNIIDLAAVAGQLPASVLPRGTRLLNVPIVGQVEQRAYFKTELPYDVQPTAFTAFFRTPPTGMVPATPVQVRFRATDAAATYVELVVDEDVDYHKATWPLVAGDSEEAEQGTREAGAAIVTDTTASNGQAVELNTQLEYVDVEFGELDAGQYTGHVNLRANVGSSTPTDDMQFTIFVDSNQVATSTFTVASNTYYEVPLNFVIPEGGGSVRMRVQKLLSTAATYRVDRFRFATSDIVTLTKGTLTVEAFLDNPPATPTPGSDVVLALWF